jgi:hypothetical protein
MCLKIVARYFRPYCKRFWRVMRFDSIFFCSTTRNPVTRSVPQDRGAPRDFHFQGCRKNTFEKV